MKSDLRALFHPRSVALVGASANPEKLSNVALRNLMKGSFRVYPINPKERSILGMRCYPSITDAPGDIDLVIVSLPAAASVEPTRECVRKGVGVVAVTASGFRESGPDGERLEEELLSSVRGSKTRLLGPNTMGVLVPSARLDSFFIPEEKSKRPNEGSIAMVSQSGAVSISFLEKAAASGIGVSACVGLGNKGDINENDILRYLAEDPATKCIAMYLESFADGRALVDIARRIVKTKPIVMLKSGRTRAGSFAARSHTGALSSSSDAVVSGILKQAGIVRVFDEEELIDVAKALAYVDHIPGDRICVIASAGGFGVIGADYVESCEHGACLKMAELSKSTIAGLRRVAPGFSSVTNPVDLTAGVTDDMYDQALTLLQKDKGVDGIMMSLELQPPHITDKLVQVAGNRSKSGGAPIVVSAFGGERTQEIMAEFERRSVPAYPTLWRAIRALKALSDRGAYLKR